MIRLLLISLLCFGCGPSVSALKRGGLNKGLGEVREYEVVCVRVGGVKKYSLVGRDLPFDVEKGLWKFVGLNEEGVVVEVVSSMCWMEREI